MLIDRHLVSVIPVKLKRGVRTTRTENRSLSKEHWLVYVRHGQHLRKLDWFFLCLCSCCCFFSQYKSFRFPFWHIWLKVGLSSLSSLWVLTEKSFENPLEQWLRSFITSLSNLKLYRCLTAESQIKMDCVPGSKNLQRYSLIRDFWQIFTLMSKSMIEGR